MECRSCRPLFFLISLFFSLYSQYSIASDTDWFRLSYSMDITKIREHSVSTPSSMRHQDTRSLHLQKVASDDEKDVESPPSETLIPDGIDKEKVGFIKWLLPQIEQAREEIGHLISIHIPNSLIVAQAALESGWGKSYGAKNRQNLFGLTRSNGKYMEFSSSLEGLKKYMTTLDRHPAYHTLRNELGKTKNSLILTKHLTSYCDCSEYSTKLNQIIRSNKLTELDV